MSKWDEDQYLQDKFDIPSRFLKYRSRYGLQSDEIQDLNQNNYSPIYTEVLDLTVASSLNNLKKLNVAGRAVVIYGVQKDTLYDPSLNTGTEVGDCANVWCRFNEMSAPSQGVMLKTGRGYVGSFTKLFLQWPAQTNMSARIIIYQWDGMPWQTGECC